MEQFYFCKNGEKHRFCCVGGIAEVCSNCTRNPGNTNVNVNEIKTWIEGIPSTNGKKCDNFIRLDYKPTLTKEEQATIMKAYNEGKTIQFSKDKEHWETCFGVPYVESATWFFRIKPEN